MPENVEAAREALLGEYGYHESDCDMGPTAGIFCTCTYPTAVKSFEAEIRREERNRLLNPSEDLLKAVVQAMFNADSAHAETGFGASMNQLARAALQAAGKI